MQNPWHVRLKARLAELRMPAVELARLTGIPEASIYKYVSGRTANPRGDALTKLAAALDVTEQWLAFGGLTPTGAVQIAHKPMGVRMIPVLNSHDLNSAVQRAEVPDIASKREPQLAVPDVVAADAFGLRIADDAMTLCPAGSLVVVDPGAPAVPGRLVAAVSTALGYAVVRRWRAINLHGAGELVADHPDFPVIPMRSEADGYVIGRVVKIIIDC